MSNSAPAVIQHRPLAPLDIEQTRTSMEVYQQGLQALLDQSDWQAFKDKSGEERRFLKRSGWRKIALWFELNIETRSVDIDRNPGGQPIRARVIARAIAPNGRYADGEGGCGLGERPFSKPEHDLPATAATRAVNRAVSNLVGLGAVSAEELDGGETAEVAAAGPYGPLADQQLEREAAQAVQGILPGIDGFALVRVLARTFDNGLPEIAARTLKGLAWFTSQPAATGSERPTPSTDPQE